jgi:KilA-N domain
MTALIIANTQIRRDTAGRYCLNDLHQASGGAKRHQPSDWLRLKQTQELVEEVLKSPEGLREFPELNPVETTEGRYGGGTYAVKELVYAYAMWISAAFHLHVIRAYDALVTATQAEPPPVLLAGPMHRADQLVSAGRIFSAALRAARQMHMPMTRAIRAAADCTQRHVGIDWPAELGVTADDMHGEPPNPDRDRLHAWLHERHEVVLSEIAAAVFVDDDSVGLRRIGALMRELGWQPHRRRDENNHFITIWRRPLHA